MLSSDAGVFYTQAGGIHQGFGCITPQACGATMQESWSWASFTLQSWRSLQNNTHSTSLATAHLSAPRLYVLKKNL